MKSKLREIFNSEVVQSAGVMLAFGVVTAVAAFNDATGLAVFAGTITVGAAIYNANAMLTFMSTGRLS